MPDTDKREIWIIAGEVTDPEAHDGKAKVGDREWQFSDGPPESRGSSADYLDLAEGLADHQGCIIHMVEPESERDAEGHWIIAYEGDSDEIPAGAKLARITPAKQVDVDWLLAQALDGNGRSPWAWVRFADGTLMLATSPQADVYEFLSQSQGVGPFYP